eukprot:352648-Chlamydomonas_euryale.AAC.7
MHACAVNKSSPCIVFMHPCMHAQMHATVHQRHAIFGLKTRLAIGRKLQNVLRTIFDEFDNAFFQFSDSRPPVRSLKRLQERRIYCVRYRGITPASQGHSFKYTISGSQF